MATILRRLPIPTTDAMAMVGQEPVLLRRYQIVVWVSLVARSSAELGPLDRRLPAVLDTGHSHFFSIQWRHLADWAGIAPATLRSVGTIRERGRRVPLRAVTVYLFGNRPGRRDADPGRPPFRLGTRRGVAVYEDGDFPRLPLIGLRALTQNHLRLTVDGDRQTVSLTAPPHWWPFG
jgi:hypothetical protein